MNLPIVFIYYFLNKLIKIQSPGEPQEHHLCIIVSDSSVFLGSGIHNPDYLEMKKILFKIAGF